MYMKCVCQEYKLKILRGTVFVKSMIQSGISRGVDGGLNQKDYQYSHMFPGATQFLQIGGCKINLPNKNIHVHVINLKRVPISRILSAGRLFFHSSYFSDS